jgi:hypothetical protein
VTLLIHDWRLNMRLMRWNVAVRMLLAIAAALSSIRAPALEHAHVESEGKHSHAELVAVLHDSSDHHHPRVGHVRHQAFHQHAKAFAGIAPVARHRHVDWFGFDLCFPVDSRNGTGISSAEVSIAVLQYGSPAALLIKNCVSHLLAPDAGDCSHIGVAIASRHLPNYSAVMADVAPLCDTARHERSGVQLF